jgi:AraC-like DNA-binding protein
LSKTETLYHDCMPQQPTIDVLWIARYDYRPGWVLPLHAHDYLQMILFLDGKGSFTISGRTFSISGGELFLIQSNEVHGFRAESLARTLDVKFRVAPGDLSGHLCGAPRQIQCNGEGIATRLERIHAEGEKKSPFYREICSAQLTEILYLYLRQDSGDSLRNYSDLTTGPAAHDQILMRAIAYIHAEYHRPLTIEKIARAAGCTDRTLRLHFHDALQTRPLLFLQQHRINQAKALIQFSDSSLKDIAQQAGFQTVHHFTRHFKAVAGRTPADWRREHLEGIRKNVYINPNFENLIFTVEGEST